MKIFKLSAGCFAILLAASSCSDFLDNPEPAQSLPATTAFTNEADLQTALIGAYNALQNSDFGATGLAINDNVLSDNAQWNGSFPSYIDMFNRELTADNGEVEGLWESAYEVINQANLILRGLSTSEDVAITDNVATRNQLRGESLFLRGFSYFELARAFGQPFGATSGSDLGVPIVTEGTLTSPEITFPSRATVQANYDQAISDLSEAAILLDDSGAPSRASATAATAILADIAFQQRNYERAAELAGQVIDAGFGLASSYEDIFFTESSSEEIFSVVSTTQDNPGVNGSLATFHHIEGRGGDVVVSDDLRDNGYLATISTNELAEAEANSDTLIDLRADLLTSNNIFNVEKYDDFANNGDDNIIVRTSTYNLMRAEALARMEGVNNESIELLNAIRSRAIVAVDTTGAQSDASAIVAFDMDNFNDADALIEAIVLERRVELAFERNRLNDLRRLMRDVRGLDFDDPRLVFPIPQRDLDANDMLIQNPGY